MHGFLNNVYNTQCILQFFFCHVSSKCGLRIIHNTLSLLTTICCSACKTKFVIWFAHFNAFSILFAVICVHRTIYNILCVLTREYSSVYNTVFAIQYVHCNISSTISAVNSEYKTINNTFYALTYVYSRVY